MIDDAHSWMRASQPSRTLSASHNVHATHPWGKHLERAEGIPQLSMVTEAAFIIAANIHMRFRLRPSPSKSAVNGIPSINPEIHRIDIH